MKTVKSSSASLLTPGERVVAHSDYYALNYLLANMTDQTADGRFAQANLRAVWLEAFSLLELNKTKTELGFTLRHVEG